MMITACNNTNTWESAALSLTPFPPTLITSSTWLMCVRKLGVFINPVCVTAVRSLPPARRLYLAAPSAKSSKLKIIFISSTPSKHSRTHSTTITKSPIMASDIEMWVVVRVCVLCG